MLTAKRPFRTTTRLVENPGRVPLWLAQGRNPVFFSAKTNMSGREPTCGTLLRRALSHRNEEGKCVAFLMRNRRMKCWLDRELVFCQRTPLPGRPPSPAAAAGEGTGFTFFKRKSFLRILLRVPDRQRPDRGHRQCAGQTSRNPDAIRPRWHGARFLSD